MKRKQLQNLLMITSDFNFVNVDFYVEYKVSDPVKYLYNSKQPTEILKNIAQSCIRTAASNFRLMMSLQQVRVKYRQKLMK